MEYEELIQELAAEGANVTSIHGLAILATLLTGFLLLRLPRRDALAALLTACILIPFGQRIVIGGFDFMMIRILILFGCARMLRSAPEDRPVWTPIDKVFLAWVAAMAVIYVLLWHRGDALTNRLGFAFTAIGVYAIFRFFVRDFDDVQRIFRVLAVMSIIVGVFIAREWLTQRNIFYVFGGVPEFTEIRDGKLRCQGPFAHALLAGSFGAACFPASFALWWQGGKGKMLGLAGCLSAICIALGSSSSGPLLSLLAAVVALAMWKVRHRMNQIRWGLAGLLVCLHLVMEAPVWALPHKIKIFGASSGFHRFELVDNFIRRVDEWSLLGTKSTMHWGEAMGYMDLWDVSNYFVSVGVKGGLLSLILFFVLLTLCFKAIGEIRNAVLENEACSIRTWCLGSMLFAMVVSFWGVVYFDQMQCIWYMTLAIVASVRSRASQPTTSQTALESGAPHVPFASFELNS
ncbi:MAG: hypothetical protein AB1813_04200 [Verrucomicrobiota bacterium]